ncbi:TPA: hypothetical protein JBF45_15785 [Legionella pneumophila]|nr:hypothetical protein [Legionella pneumophila]HAU0282401.1 hypothetical protein [Legionella pneumophila]HBD9332840.1 hypothetical protein [Legionella pneumophila]
MQYQPIMKQIRAAISKNDADQLLNITSTDWVMVYLYTDNIFVNSFTVEQENFDLYDSDKILSLDFPLKESSISCFRHSEEDGYNNSMEVSHECGLDDSLMWPLFFSRANYKDGKLITQYELLQHFVHANGLYLDNEKGTFNLINEDGDVEPRALIIVEQNFHLILFERKALDYYLGYANHFLVRFFELKELVSPLQWSISSLQTSKIKRRIYEYEDIPRFKGAEIVQTVYSIEQIEKGDPKKYEDFIINDFKNSKIVEWSCAPEMLDNYYKDTGKPFETSPAFFNPEVLSKYKNNHEKYEVRDRGVRCYGSWSLKSYSINDEGQVHAYIYCLGQLPHKEQLHWKQYNEEPKAGISQVAYNTDFLAEFDEEKSSLRSIKQKLANFPSYYLNKEKFVLWAPKGGDIDVLFNQVHPVITEIKKEYRDYLLNLTILVIDGLEDKTIRNLVQANEKTNPLQCLEMLLKSWGSQNTVIIMKALRALQRKRSKFAGHGGGEIDFDTKADSLKITDEIDQAIQLLCEEIEKNSK